MEQKKITIQLFVVCATCGGELEATPKPAYTGEGSVGIQVGPCEQCKCQYEEGIKKGRKAALEWAYKQESDLQATEIGDAILRELGS